MVRFVKSSRSLRAHQYLFPTFAAASLAAICLLAPPTPLYAQSPAPQKAAQPDPLHDLSASMQSLVRKVAPSVVQILVTSYAPLEGHGSTQTGLVIGRQRAIGSGVIVDPDGYILTNAHVVNNAARLQVVLPGLSSEGSPISTLAAAHGLIVDGQVIGLDTDMDIALVKIQSKGLPALPFAKYSDLRQGEVVLAFGSPEGLRNSVTLGVVSAVARQIDPDSPYIYIQTDAAINPGNSGGPLVNVNGQVVGLNTMIVTQSGGNEGLGFAIPSGLVSVVYPQLRQFGHVHRPEIGASVQTITPELASALGLPRDTGVVVSDVTPGGPAESAGLKIQDLVLALDGRPIDSVPMLYYRLFVRDSAAGVKMQVQRGAQTLALDVPVIMPHHATDNLIDLANPEKNLVHKLGILGVEITPDIARQLSDLRAPYGVIVVARTLDPGAADSSLATGDVIHAINGTAVDSLQTLRTALDNVKPYASVVLQIERDSKLRYLTLQMP